jgi:hypothetical protein
MTPAHNFSKWDFKNRLGVLAAETGERFRDRRAGRSEDDDIPVTVIPAQPRGSTRTWSPEVLIQQQQAQQARRTHDRSPAAAGALSTDEPPTPADLSHSTTLTSNSLPAAEAASRDSNTPRANDASTSASPVVVQSPRRHLPRSQNSFSRQCDPPPRADDISPSGGSTGTVTVVPAPRRSPLRAVSTTPPMAHDAASTSNAALGDELSPGGYDTQRHSPLRHHTTPPTRTP